MSRSKILEAIKRNKPGVAALPEISLEHFNEDLDLVQAFIGNAELGASKVIHPSDKENFNVQLHTCYPGAERVCSLAEEWLKGTVDIGEIQDPRDLEDLDLLVVKGAFGVAENGAVWIPETNLVHRVLPFITRNLAILLNKQQIVQHMHEAYTLLASYDEGFGVFIAGPSKTADIEQSLVIGAQSALTNTIFLTE